MLGSRQKFFGRRHRSEDLSLFFSFSMQNPAIEIGTNSLMTLESPMVGTRAAGINRFNSVASPNLTASKAISMSCDATLVLDRTQHERPAAVAINHSRKGASDQIRQSANRQGRSCSRRKSGVRLKRCNWKIQPLPNEWSDANHWEKGDGWCDSLQHGAVLANRYS